MTLQYFLICVSVFIFAGHNLLLFNLEDSSILVTQAAFHKHYVSHVVTFLKYSLTYGKFPSLTFEQLLSMNH